MARPRDPYELAREKYPWAYQDDPGPSRARQLAGDLANLAVTVVLLVGLPLVMLKLAPWPPLPIPHHLDLTREGIQGWYNGAPWEDTRLVIGAGVTIGWVCWAILLLDTAYTVLLAVVDAVRYRRLRPRTPGRSPTRVAARMIVAGLIAVTVAITSRLTAAHAAPPAPPAAVAAQHQPHTIDPDQPVTLTTAAHTHRVHTVAAGDTLWDLARRYLHDPQQWRAIYRANHGHLQPDGRRLERPDRLMPGWRLQIPTRSTPARSEHQRSPAPASPARPGSHHRAGLAPTPPAATRGSPDATHPRTHPTSRSAGREPARPPGASALGPATAGRHSAVRGSTRVALPGGSMIGIGLASVMLAGITAVAALRWRRRYQPHRQQALTVADTPLVRALSAAVPSGRLPEPSPDEAPGTAVADAGPGHVMVAAPLLAGDDDDADPDPDQRDPDEFSDTDASGGPAPDGVAEISGVVGVDDRQVGPEVALLDRPLTVLAGDGALGAARALLAAHLTGGIPSGHLMLSAEDLAVLADLGPADAGSLPPVVGLSITATHRQALTLVDAELIRRGRTTQAQPDLTARPEAAERAVVFLLDPDTAQRRRLTGQLAQDGVHAVVIATAPDATGWPPITVDGHGRARDQGEHPQAVRRVVEMLTAADLRDLLATLTTTTQPPADPPSTETPAEATQEATTQADAEAASPTSAAGDRANGRTDAAAGRRHNTDADPTLPQGMHQHDLNRPRAEQTGNLAAGRSAPPASRPQPDASPESGAPWPAEQGGIGQQDAASSAVSSARTQQDTVPVTAPQTDGTDSSDHPDRQSELPKARVSVLGIPTIHGPNGEPMSGLRARAAQILTYLALTDRPGASTEKLIDATIEGPVRYKDGANRIHTDVANLRSVLAAACGDQHAPRAGYIRKSHDRYVIDADRVEIDLWQMRAAINQAAAAPDRPRRIAALQTAIGFYQGEFATGIDQLWVATGRTGVANEALGAVTDLAELYLDTDPHRSLGLLRRAIGWSPFTEDLYRRLMRVHHRMGNPDGIRTALHTLTARLAEIGATPEKETTQMASRLLSTLGGRTRPAPA